MGEKKAKTRDHGFREEAFTKLFGREFASLAEDTIEGSEEHSIFVDVFFGQGDECDNLGAINLTTDERKCSKVLESSELFCHIPRHCSFNEEFELEETCSIDGSETECPIACSTFSGSLVQVENCNNANNLVIQDDVCKEADECKPVAGSVIRTESCRTMVASGNQAEGFKDLAKSVLHVEERKNELVPCRDVMKPLGEAEFCNGSAVSAIKTEACRNNNHKFVIAETVNLLEWNPLDDESDFLMQEIINFQLLEASVAMEGSEHKEAVDVGNAHDSVPVLVDKAQNSGFGQQHTGDDFVLPHVGVSPALTLNNRTVSQLQTLVSPRTSEQNVESSMEVKNTAVKRMVRRELPEQLECHVHMLLREAGWSITPRIRKERSRLASFFKEPGGKTFTSLSQAWKFCGNLLCTTSLEKQYSSGREWCNAKEFWDDLRRSLADMDNALEERQRPLTLLQRWQHLDPFVAVIYISRKISILLKGITVRAVNSSAYVLTSNPGVGLKDHNIGRTDDGLLSADHFSPTSPIKSILLTEDSNCKSVLSKDSDNSNLRGSCQNMQVKMKRCPCCGEHDCKDVARKCSLESDLAFPAGTSSELRKSWIPTNTTDDVVKRPMKKSKKMSIIGEIGYCGSPDIQSCSHFEDDVLQGESIEVRPHSSLTPRCTSRQCGPTSNSRKQDLVHNFNGKLVPSAVEMETTSVNTNSKISKQKGACSMYIQRKSTFLDCERESAADKGLCKMLPSLAYLLSDNSMEESLVSNGTGNDKVLPAQCRSDESVHALNDAQYFMGSPFECKSSNAIPYSGFSLETKLKKKSAGKKESEGCNGDIPKRPYALHLRDEDLLITAIIKNKDLNRCRNFPFNSCSSELKKLKKLKGAFSGGKKSVRTIGSGGKKSLKPVLIKRKTVLAWLLATGAVAENETVQYRDMKNKIVKDGFVTCDGILCCCCNNIFSVSEFKEHAGSMPPMLSLNLFMQSGKSYTLCQLESWSAEYLSRINHKPVVKEEDEVDQNDDTCGICGDGGELLCCDNCPSTYHQACTSMQDLPEGSWYCHNCVCQICGRPVLTNGLSVTSTCFKCLQCDRSYHVSCNPESICRDNDSSKGRFCGSNCRDIFAELRNSTGVKNFLGDGLSWTLLRCNHDEKKLTSPQKIALMVEGNTKLAVALSLMEECFVRMIDPRTGIDMIPHVLYNIGSALARLNCQGFYTIILEKGDELISVASIRLHGSSVAELPFVATSTEHRRKGMCRRLMDIIEKILRSLRVRMLVLSAIPELVDTWIKGFGFKPIEDNERKQLNKINLMLFPDALLLFKKLNDSEVDITSKQNILGLTEHSCESEESEVLEKEKHIDNGFSVPFCNGLINSDATSFTLEDLIDWEMSRLRLTSHDDLDVLPAEHNASDEQKSSNLATHNATRVHDGTKMKAQWPQNTNLLSEYVYDGVIETDEIMHSGILQSFNRSFSVACDGPHFQVGQT